MIRGVARGRAGGTPPTQTGKKLNSKGRISGKIKKIRAKPRKIKKNSRKLKKKIYDSFKEFYENQKFI